MCVHFFWLLRYLLSAYCMLGPFTHLKHCNIKAHFQIRNWHLREVTPLHDQPVINGRGSAPLDLGNSYAANVQNASEGPR